MGGIEDRSRTEEDGLELDDGPASPVLNAFIEGELARLESLAGDRDREPPPGDPLNVLFRELLTEAWA